MHGVPKAEILATDPIHQTAVIRSSAASEAIISKNAHAAGRCGGYEKIQNADASLTSAGLLGSLAALKLRQLQTCAPALDLIQKTKAAVDQVSAANIENSVRWYSSFRTRYHASSTANEPVLALQARLQTIVAGKPNVRVETIAHQSTAQKSIRVWIGSGHPQAPAVVLGGHLDSINGWGWGDPSAPGADDNASGVGALLEAVRVLVSQPTRPAHDIIVYWYAGEEAGLLGSAEIARDAKKAGTAIRGILQLDMTMFAGDGPMVIASMTDFTDPRLRNWLKDFNGSVLNATIVDDQCGYGCSDHASWYRQGYATLMPFEATFDRMNRNIHTARDVVDASSNFEHAAAFAKIAVGFALSAPNTNACL